MRHQGNRSGHENETNDEAERRPRGDQKETSMISKRKEKETTRKPNIAKHDTKRKLNRDPKENKGKTK